MEEKVNFIEESDKFYKLFQEFEELIKQRCIKSGINTDGVELYILINKLSEKSRYFKNKKLEIDIMRDIRNIYSHSRDEKYRYVVCPNPEINNKLKDIINEIKNPPLIYESPICIKDIFNKTMDDSIYDTIKMMTEKMYTHIPIFENKKLIGVFSENTLLDVVRNETGIILDNNTKFKSIEKYLKIENHSMEEFIFVSRRKNIYDIEDIFKDYFFKTKRIGCIYVTENGKDTENILGMLTAWDVLGNG